MSLLKYLNYWTTLGVFFTEPIFMMLKRFQ